MARQTEEEGRLLDLVARLALVFLQELVDFRPPEPERYLSAELLQVLVAASREPPVISAGFDRGAAVGVLEYVWLDMVNCGMSEPARQVEDLIRHLRPLESEAEDQPGKGVDLGWPPYG